MKTLFSIAFALAILIGPSEGNKIKTTTLTVKISGIKNTSGIIGVALFDEDNDFPEGDSFRDGGGSISTSGTMEVVFEDIPEGDYAVAVLHDENENEDIDFNDQGMPTEGFGFSNNVMGDMGPPSFDEAAFSVDGDTEIEVNLVYLMGYKNKSEK